MEMSLPRLLFFGIAQTKGDVMDAAAAEPCSPRVGLHVDMDLFARPAAVHGVNDDFFGRIIRVRQPFDLFKA